MNPVEILDLRKFVAALSWRSRWKEAILGFLLIVAFGKQVCHGQAQGTGSGGVTYTVQDIWSDGTYNAFTDLTRYDGDWYVVFRTASEHGIPPAGQPGGEIRVLRSADGQNWSSVALLSNSGADFRDPKITVTPNNQLMIIAGSFSQTSPYPLQSAAFFSSDGTNWGTPYATGKYDYWTWRTVWHNGVGYGISYGPNNTAGTGDSQASVQYTQLLTTTDGVQYSTLASPLNPSGWDSDEAGLTFLPDGTAVELVRRDYNKTSGVGVSAAASNYANWTLTSANLQLESPDLLTLPDGRIVAAGRTYTWPGGVETPNTELCWLDPKSSTLTPFLIFPDNIDDSGYPGEYWYNNKLWVSFYSNTSGPNDIYLAQVSIPPASWTAAVSGSWSTASNWGGAVPSAPGALVVINAPSKSPLTVTLDAPQTVGTLQLGNSASASTGYVIAGNRTGTLTLDNSGSGATITVTDGTHVINAPVFLDDNLVVTGSGTLTFGNHSSITEVGARRSLVMNGAGGTLILSGTDNYTGGTFVTTGKLIVTSVDAIPDGTDLTVGDMLAFGSVASASSTGLQLQAPVPVPESGTVVLLLAGLLAGVVCHWRARPARTSPGPSIL